MAKSNQQQGLLQLSLEEHRREEKKNTPSFSNVNTLFLFSLVLPIRRVSPRALRGNHKLVLSLAASAITHSCRFFVFVFSNTRSVLACPVNAISLSELDSLPPHSFFCRLFFYALRHARTLSSLALLFKKVRTLVT